MLSLKLLFRIGVYGCVCDLWGASISSRLVRRELLRPLCYSVMLMLILFSAREIGCGVLFVRSMIIRIEMFSA